MSLTLGIDGGASAAKWSLREPSGNFRDGVAQPIDGHIYRPSSQERLRQVLHEIKVAAGNEKVSAIYAGITGLGSESEEEATAIFASIFPDAKISTVLDIVLGYRSHLHFGEGIFLYSGTGSIAIHIDREDRVHRAGGWGYLLGDEGGGYWIGIQALRRVLSRMDRGIEIDNFDHKILEILNARTWDEIKSFVYSRDRSEIAALATKVVELANAGDASAGQILAEAGEHLGDLVLQLDQRLNNSRLPVVLGGGISGAGQILVSRIEERIGRPANLSSLNMARRAAELALEL